MTKAAISLGNDIDSIGRAETLLAQFAESGGAVEMAVGDTIVMCANVPDENLQALQQKACESAFQLTITDRPKNNEIILGL